jgi:hypothetical protein
MFDHIAVGFCSVCYWYFVKEVYYYVTGHFTYFCSSKYDYDTVRFTYMAISLQDSVEYALHIWENSYRILLQDASHICSHPSTILIKDASYIWPRPCRILLQSASYMWPYSFKIPLQVPSDISSYMEAIHSQETSILTNATRRNITENGIPLSHRPEHFKSLQVYYFISTAKPADINKFVYINVNKDCVGITRKMSCCHIVTYAFSVKVKVSPWPVQSSNSA